MAGNLGAPLVMPNHVGAGGQALVPSSGILESPLTHVMLWAAILSPVWMLASMDVFDLLIKSLTSRSRRHLMARDFRTLAGKPLGWQRVRLFRHDYELIGDGVVRATFQASRLPFGRVARGVCASGPWRLERKGLRNPVYTFRVTGEGGSTLTYAYTGAGSRFDAVTRNATPFTFRDGIPESAVFSSGARLATITTVSMWPLSVQLELAIEPTAPPRTDLTPIVMLAMYRKTAHDYSG